MASTPAVVITPNAVRGQPGSGDAGGALALVGGAGDTAQAGGAISVTGGAGTTSGAGGAASLTGGAGGNAAAGGAVTVAAGASTGAAGAAVNITASAGNGTTNAGGDVNITAGAAASTGTPGEFKVNSVAGTTEVNWFQPLSTTAAPATASVVSFFMANRAWRIKAISVIEATFGTSETYTFHKNTGTTAPGAGTALLTGAITMAVNNTRVVGTLSSTVATVTLAAGDRVSFTVGGTVGSAAGVNVSMLLVPA